MLLSLKELLSKFDSCLFDQLKLFTNELNTSIMVGFSFLASSSFLLPANILLASYFLLLKKDKWSFFRVAAISISSFLVMISLKLYFHRVRPLHPVHLAASGFSFPSGHAMSAMTFYGLLIYFVVKQIRNRLVKWIFILSLTILILIIGFSRVYLRVHYGSDVLAGFIFGYIWLMFSLYIFDHRYQKRTYENDR